MSSTVVLGMQWGDEGKGKLVDLICPAFDAVVRYQGGDNAGHTVKFGDRHFALHLVPSGILHPGKSCVLGNGMVVRPEALFEELDGLAASGVDPAGRLFVSPRAHAILPPHLELDAAREAAAGSGRIGTTVRGIGPAYESKAARVGLRLGDLVSPALEERLGRLLEHLGGGLERLGRPRPEPAALLAACRGWGARLEPLLADTSYLLNGWLDAGRSLLFEGAQGALLDIDHGTYPYVTSSSPTTGGVGAGSGVPPRRIDGVLGILKAYTTRVGAGPFVSELADDEGDFLRRRGNEFGTTTGRPRRCGWLDAVAARYAVMLNGVDAVALTKMDVLDTLDEIRICVAYRIDGEERRRVPATIEELARAEPVYRTLPGWRSDTVGCVDFDRLPEAARAYVAAIEEEVGAPVAIVSSGPRREETILRPGAALERLLPAGSLPMVRAAVAG
jgi:adenylosuccinate synthase